VFEGESAVVISLDAASDPLIVQKYGEADLVSLNRPARLNTLDECLMVALLE
jgi:hypothetical protein